MEYLTKIIFKSSKDDSNKKMFACKKNLKVFFFFFCSRKYFCIKKFFGNEKIFMKALILRKKIPERISFVHNHVRKIFSYREFFNVQKYLFREKKFLFVKNKLWEKNR